MKMSKRIAATAVIVAVTTLSGCAVRNTMMVHPATGEMGNCNASGWGWIGAPIALMSHSQCIESMQSVGYVPVSSIEPSKLVIETDPPGAQILAGATEKDLRVIGVGPMHLVHPKKARLWSAECYQAKMPGRVDSDIDCRPQVSGDREVKLKLKD